MSKISKTALTMIAKEIKALESQKLVEREIFANARTQGDLSENNDYHDSKDRLNILDRRIAELTIIQNRSVVVSPPTNPEYVCFGTIVLLEDKNGKQCEYQIASDYESENYMNDKDSEDYVKSEKRVETISETSMIGKAVMSKKVGEVVKFTTLKGETREYRILKIRGAEEN